MLHLIALLLLLLGLPTQACQTAIIGTGIGGAYTAFRLASQGHSVCIFEANQRPGGRILTVHDPIPTFENYTIDLGAYRYNRQSQRMMRQLVEDVLKLPILCYTDPFNIGKCPGAQVKLWATRGRTLFDDETVNNILKKWGRYLPYSIAKQFRWGRKEDALGSRRTILGLVFGNRSVIPEIRDRFQELEEETDYVKAMRIADEIIDAMKNGTYQGIPYADICPLQIAEAEGLTREEIQLDVDLGFAFNYVVRYQLELLAQLTVRQEAVEDLKGVRGLVTPVEERDGRLRRVGMGRIVEELLKKSGVEVKYGKKAIRVNRADDGFEVEFEGGDLLEVEKVVLNVGKAELIALGVGSEPLRGGSVEFKRAVERNFVTGASKTYCFWEDAWWVNVGLLDGRARAHQEPLDSLRYHDGHVVCKDWKNMKGCRGGMLVSYSFGDTTGVGMAIHTLTHNKKPYSPLTNTDNVHRVLKNATGIEKLYLDGLWQGVKRVHKQYMKKRGLDVDKVIPRPEGCVFADWRDVGIHTEFPTGKGDTNIFKLFAEPVKNLALVNEAWSQDQGWAEGSLHSAERALFHTFGLEKPEWMDEEFHRSVIRNFNQGSAS